MQDGNIELNGNNIDLGTTGTLTGESNDDRIFGTTGSLTTTRILNAPTNVNVAGTGIEITSAANMGSTVITRRHNQYVIEGSSIFRNFNISPATNTGLDATIRFHYFENELGGLTEAELGAERSTNGGASWIVRGGTPVPASDYLELGGIDAFSLWTLSGATPLPLEWISFQAQLIERNTVDLLWQTADEESVSHFSIESSFDGQEFVRIAEVSADNQHKNKYQAIDSYFIEESGYYRIKQVDYNGKFTMSETRFVEQAFNSQFSVYPTFFQSSSAVIFIDGLMPEKTYGFSITDGTGKILIPKEYSTGTERHKMTVENVSSGIYYLKVFPPHALPVTTKIIVTH
jgi:hypothetical protein